MKIFSSYNYTYKNEPLLAYTCLLYTSQKSNGSKIIVWYQIKENVDQNLNIELSFRNFKIL